MKSKKKSNVLLLIKAASSLILEILRNLFKSKEFWTGLVFGCLFISVVVFGICEKKDTKAHTDDVTPTAYIVYTDETGDPYAVPTIVNSDYKAVPLTTEERDKIASIVAGKSGNKPVSVQLMVANVIMNDYLACDGDLDVAIRAYELDTYKTPTDDQYAVVDAVFERGELSLDDDVLYMRKTGSKSSFHDSRTFVCEYFGISFYKDR